jgi:hypothetical protein
MLADVLYELSLLVSRSVMRTMPAFEIATATRKIVAPRRIAAADALEDDVRDGPRWIIDPDDGREVCRHPCDVFAFYL